VRTSVGFLGYLAGPTVHIVDPLALTDPLLARLPAVDRPDWRPGHHLRALPEGYLLSLDTGADLFADRGVGEYYRRLCLLTRGPLFDPERLQTLLAFNLGWYNHLIDVTAYRTPTCPLVDPGDLASQPDLARAHPFTHAGLALDFRRRSLPAWLILGLETHDLHEVFFYRGDALLERRTVVSRDNQLPGPFAHRLEIPDEVRAQGCDRLVIRPDPKQNYSGGWCLAFVQLPEE
jgi:arabinofuranosyltransferase